MPGRCLARLDIYDGTRVGAGSVERARRATPRRHDATRCGVTELPHADASCDVVTLVFAAHEVTSPGDRDRLFAEVRRALRPGGRLLLVEHPRDTPNFLAFGPGFLHFLPRREWLRVARCADLTVAGALRVTPWVMALSLEKTR
jgi:SAM-dependent methyltransferase